MTALPPSPAPGLGPTPDGKAPPPTTRAAGSSSEADAAGPSSASGSGPLPAARGGARILVADDSESDRHAARDALGSVGHHVIEAIDGQQALEVFARERPDLVMLDVVMPRLSGLECCRILKAKTQHAYLPVVMVSTRNSVNARVEGLRSGADDYLGKPYDPEELRARVEALLRAKRMLGDAEAARAEATEIAGDARLDPAHMRRLEQEFDRAERYSDPLACLRVALDEDAAPIEARTRLRTIVDATVRKIDLVFPSRPSGFLLTLPNTHFPGALAVAERIARDSKSGRTGIAAGSVSIGVSFFPNKDVHALRELLELCDAALERARADGGGRICLYQHQGYIYAPEDP